MHGRVHIHFYENAAIHVYTYTYVKTLRTHWAMVSSLTYSHVCRDMEHFKSEIEKHAVEQKEDFETWVENKYEPAKASYEDMQESRDIKAKLKLLSIEMCNW